MGVRRKTEKDFIEISSHREGKYTAFAKASKCFESNIVCIQYNNFCDGTEYNNLLEEPLSRKILVGKIGLPVSAGCRFKGWSVILEDYEVYKFCSPIVDTKCCWLESTVFQLSKAVEIQLRKQLK